MAHPRLEDLVARFQSAAQQTGPDGQASPEQLKVYRELAEACPAFAPNLLCLSWLFLRQLWIEKDGSGEPEETFAEVQQLLERAVLGSYRSAPALVELGFFLDTYRSSPHEAARLYEEAAAKAKEPLEDAWFGLLRYWNAERTNESLEKALQLGELAEKVFPDSDKITQELVTTREYAVQVSNAVSAPEHPFRRGDANSEEIFNAMNQCYAIPDACERGDTDIYVLESPHLHEMMYRRMLAGDSGVVFSQRLSADDNTKVPFGLYGIAPWRSKPSSLQGIGAINACCFPMQADTYGPARSSLPGLDKAVKVLRRLRERPESNRRDAWDREFEELIVVALAERVRPFVAEGVIFHPCGNVARGLLNKARSLIKGDNFEVSSLDIPHPSRDTWRRSDLVLRTPRAPSVRGQPGP